jgi:tRNA threonylcarbamoyladenosine biosynthesis protein TsaB
VTVLGIETATAVCGAALVRDGTVLALREVRERYVHAERLLLLVEEVLAEGRLAPNDLTAVAVSAGPGSFTGLRIGVSTAKGVVYATGAALVGVPTLEALAARCLSMPGSRPEWILAALDARRDEVYAQLFRVHNGCLQTEAGVRDLAASALGGYVSGRNVLITGDGADKVAVALQAAGDTFALAPTALRDCTAAQVALLGERMARAGAHADPVTMEPHYIKEFFLRVG